MTILVTGATGLVGERLLPRLVDAGIDCRALLRGGKKAPDGIETVEGELFDATSLERALAGVSAVVHLAAIFRTQDQDLIWKSNLEGTRNLIDATKRCSPTARFIMASTGNIYDLNASRPGREDDAATPQRAYPASKLAAEKELRESGLTWSVLRFAFVYGDKDGHIESLPRIAAQGQLTFQPAARMSMIHHSDVAHAVRLALSGALDGQIVNIADDAPTSMYELFSLVGAAMGPSAEPLLNPWHLHLDNTHARALGFRPQMRTVFQAAEEDAL